MDFSTEVILVTDRVIFVPAEGGARVPAASEAGIKSADRGRKARELIIPNNLLTHRHRKPFPFDVYPGIHAEGFEYL